MKKILLLTITTIVYTASNAMEHPSSWRIFTTKAGCSVETLDQHALLLRAMQLPPNTNLKSLDTKTICKGLLLAIERNLPIMVKFLLKYYPNINAKDAYKQTLLHSAARWGRTDFIKLLIDKGAIISPHDMNGNTPLHLAIMWKQLDAAKLLCTKTSINAINKDGDTPLHLAALNNDLEAVTQLLLKNAKLNIKNNNGLIPIDLVNKESFEYFLIIFPNEPRKRPCPKKSSSSKKNTAAETNAMAIEAAEFLCDNI